MGFSEPFGQDKAQSQLDRLKIEGLPSVLLFYGPEGVGKKTTGLVLAKDILCDKKQRKACGHCSSCLRVEKMVHPNCLFLSPEGTHKIDAIRQVLKLTSLTPFEEGLLIVLIDEADKLTEAAANALLKTLEEPPPSVLFILITSLPGLLPPTILSRCQKIAFGPLPEKWIQGKLIASGFDESEALFLAEASGGSLGIAEKMGSALKNKDYSLTEFFSRFPQFSSREISLWVERLSKEPETTETFLWLLRYFLKDKITKEQRYRRGWDLIGEAERAIKGHSPRNLTLEVLLHRMAA